MDTEDQPSKYLKTLLLYHEEEVMGEAYFLGLADYFDLHHERTKLALLARVERYAAESVRPLLEKYGLSPREDQELRLLGEKWIGRHKDFSWQALMTDMALRYPTYLVSFDALLQAAPEEDRPAIEILTNHEIAAIEFAKMELDSCSGSLKPIYDYLRTGKIDASYQRANPSQT